MKGALAVYRFPGIPYRIVRVRPGQKVTPAWRDTDDVIDSVRLGEYIIVTSLGPTPGDPRRMTGEEVEVVSSILKSSSSSKLSDPRITRALQGIVWYTGIPELMGDPLGYDGPLDPGNPVILGDDSPILSEFLTDLRRAIVRTGLRLARFPWDPGETSGKLRYSRVIGFEGSLDRAGTGERLKLSLITEGSIRVPLVNFPTITLEWPGFPEKYLGAVTMVTGDLFTIDLRLFPRIPGGIIKSIPGKVWRFIKENLPGSGLALSVRYTVKSWEIQVLSPALWVMSEGPGEASLMEAIEEIGRVSWNGKGFLWRPPFSVKPSEGSLCYDSPITGIRYEVKF